MSRKFIATVLAAAVALTALTAKPAAATDSQALLRTLGVGTALLVVGSAIRNAKADEAREERKDQAERKAREAARKAQEEANRYADRNGNWRDWDRRDRDGRSWNRGRVDNDWRRDNRGLFGWGNNNGKWGRPAALPGSCLINAKHGRKVFAAECLQRRYEDSARLPKACRDSVRTRRGKVSVFDPQCLRQNGFDIARY